MNINDLLSPLPEIEKQPIHDEHLMTTWEQLLKQSGFQLKTTCERNTLTDAILSPLSTTTHHVHLHDNNNYNKNYFIKDTPIHMKVIGRHMNGSFRCHIGTGKASRPIQSKELHQQMRLLAVFFRAENSKSQLVSPDFIFFPTWLFHLFRYTQYDTTPGRTDVRFLEDASLAKEDHIYRLNHVLNSLFRFNLRRFHHQQLVDAIALANYLFDHVGLDSCLTQLPCPSPISYQQQLIMPPSLYTSLINYLHAPRPLKKKPMCHNCNTKIASRRKLCVACYRYHLKHGEPRPLRLIVANRPGPKHHQQQNLQQQKIIKKPNKSSSSTTTTAVLKSTLQQKICANCGVNETHQWYRNLCGQGHWCETCKSYYLRHNKVRPPELFMKAAKRKVNVRSLVSWATLDWDHKLNIHYQQLKKQQEQQIQQKQEKQYGPYSPILSSPSSSSPSSFNSQTSFPSSSSSSSSSSSYSPVLTTNWGPSNHFYQHHPRRNSSNSDCHSPASIASPTTPPPLPLPSIMDHHFKPLTLSLPSSSSSSNTTTNNNTTFYSSPPYSTL